MRSLCHTCINSHIMQGPGESQQLIRCNANYNVPFTVDFPVVQCDRHQLAGRMSIYFMEKIAHVLTVKNGKVAGFAPPKEDP